MNIRCYQQKKDYFIYETFDTNLMVTTKKKKNLEQKHETLKKEETKKNIIENCQNKMGDRNTRKKKQWRQPEKKR